MARYKNKQSNPILSFIIIGIMGIVFLFFGIKELIAINGDLLDFNTASKEELTDGTYVEGTFTYGYGAYCENVETKYGVVKRTTGYYYLQDVCEQAPEGQAYFIGVQVSDGMSDEFDNLCYSENPTPVTIKGRIKKQESKISGYMDDYIYQMFSYYDDLSASDASQLKAETLHLYIDVVSTSDYLIPIIIGLAFILLAVLTLIFSLRKKKKDAAYSQSYGSAAYNQTGNQGYDASTFGNNNYSNNTYGNAAYNDNTYANGNAYNQNSMPNVNTASNPAYVDPFVNTGDESTIALNDPSESPTVLMDDTNGFKLNK